MKDKRNKVKKIVKRSIFAALYIMLTYLTYPVSYGDLGIEFRISEVLILLCFFDKGYIVSFTCGCFISNLFGTMGIIDAIFGSIATFVSCYCISKMKNIFIASIFPIIFNGLVVGLELHFIFEIPLVYSILGVALGELVVITFIGCPLFMTLKKNKSFIEFIMIDNKYDI